MTELIVKNKKKKGIKKHGFLARTSTHSGRKVIARRRQKGRASL